MTERELQEAVRQLAALYGWRYFHVFNSRRSPAGFPDCVLVKPPRLVIAELKSDDGRVTPAQKVWLEDLRRSSCEVYVWKPADLQDIARILSPASEVGRDSKTPSGGRAPASVWVDG